MSAKEIILCAVIGLGAVTCLQAGIAPVAPSAPAAREAPAASSPQTRSAPVARVAPSAPAAPAALSPGRTVDSNLLNYYRSNGRYFTNGIPTAYFRNTNSVYWITNPPYGNPVVGYTNYPPRALSSTNRTSRDSGSPPPGTQ